MAIRFKNFENENPFNFRGMVVFLNENPENLADDRVSMLNEHLADKLTGFHDAEVLTDILSRQEDIREIAANDDAWKAFLNNGEHQRLLKAAEELQKAYKAREKSPEGYEEAKKAFVQAISEGEEDLIVSPKELKKIVLARKQVDARLVEAEIKLWKDPSKLKEHAIYFLKDSKGNRITDLDTTLDPDSTYTVDFAGNSVAKNHVGLSDLDPWLPDEINITAPGKETKTVFRIGSEYNEGLRGSKSYISIWDGYEIGLPATTDREDTRMESATIDGMLNPETTETPKRTQTRLSESDLPPHLRRTAVQPGEEFSYLSSSPAAAESFESFLSYDHTENLTRFEGLEKATIRESIWESLDEAAQIRFLNRFHSGDAIAESLLVFARTRDLLNADEKTGALSTSTQTMWTDILDRHMFGKGKSTITLNEIAQEVYGEKWKKLIGGEKSLYAKLEKQAAEGKPGAAFELATLRTFLDAVYKFMRNLPELERNRLTDINIDALREKEEGSEFAKAEKFLLQELNLSIGYSGATSMDTWDSDPVQGTISERSKAWRILSHGIEYGEKGEAKLNPKKIAEHLNFLIEISEYEDVEKLDVESFSFEEDQELTPQQHNAINNGIQIETKMLKAEHERKAAEKIRETYGSFAANVVEGIEEASTLDLTAAEKIEIASKVKTHLIGGVFLLMDKVKGELTFQNLRAAFGINLPLLEKAKTKLGLDFNIVGGPGNEEAVWSINGTGAGFRVEQEVGRVHIGARGGLQYGDGALGVNFGIRAGYEVNEATQVFAQVGAGVTLKDKQLEVLTAGLGFDTDPAIRTALDAQKYIDENREAAEKFIQDIEAALPENLTPAQRQAFINGAIAYIKERAEKEAFDGFPQVALNGGYVGLDLGYDPTERAMNPVGLHAFLKIGFKGKTAKFYNRPLTELDASAQRAVQEQLDQRLGEGETFALDMPEPVLIDPRVQTEISRDDLVAADLYAEEVIRLHNEKLHGHGLHLERAYKLIKIDVASADGYVHLWEDPNSNINVIYDTTGVYIDLSGTESFRPIVIQKRYPFEMGGETNYTEVIITDQENPDIESIKATSKTKLAWYQTIEGKKSGVVEMQTQVEGQDLIDLTSEFLGESNLSTSLESKAELILKWNYLPQEVKQNIIDRELEVGARRQQELTNIADWMNANPKYQPKYKELEQIEPELYGGDMSKMDKVFMEAINARNTELGLPEIATEEDYLNAFSWEDRMFLRQTLMERVRPRHGETPPGFNKIAFKGMMKQQLAKLFPSDPENAELAQNATDLLMGYYDTKWEELKANPDTFDEGSKLIIHVNANNEYTVTQGHYFEEIHGKIFGRIDWYDEASLKEKFGQDLDMKLIKKIRESIEDLTEPELPFSSPENAEFEQVIYTVTGQKLLQNATDIYGSIDGELLQAMADGSARKGYSLYDATLAKRFAHDVATLLMYKTLTVRSGDRNQFSVKVDLNVVVSSGLYAACYNIAHSRNEVITYKGTTQQRQRPEQAQVESVAARVTEEDFMETDTTQRAYDVITGAGYRTTEGGENQGTKDADGIRDNEDPTGQTGVEDPENSAF